MRYYSVILININRGVIEICDIGTPCTKKEAQQKLTKLHLHHHNIQQHTIQTQSKKHTKINTN